MAVSTHSRLLSVVSLLVVACSVLAPERAWAGKFRKIALLELAAKSGIKQAQLDVLGDMIATELRRMGFEVVTKDDIESMLGLEKTREFLGCTDASCMAQIGGALGVDGVVSGNVAGFKGSLFVVNLKLIDIRHAKVENSVSEKVKGGEQALVECFGPMVGRLMGRGVTAKVPGRGVTAKVPEGYVLIKPGTFMMGSPSNEPGRNDDERQHRVEITYPFYLKATEVTQGEWKALMGNNPSDFKDCGDNCPVENVTWYDAVKYCNALSRKEGLEECYSGENLETFKGLSCKGYRLPTEAEWEYAARAGTTTPFYTGSCLSTDQANYYCNYPLKGCAKGGYREKTIKVGSFQPNAWGLYDMHGNVWEWVNDWYCKEYPVGFVRDPLGPLTGSDRVERGGSWVYDASVCRSAVRSRLDPGARYDDLGFRPARSAK